MFTIGQALTYPPMIDCGCANGHGGVVSYRRKMEGGRSEVFSCRGSLTVSDADLTPLS